MVRPTDAYDYFIRPRKGAGIEPGNRWVVLVVCHFRFLHTGARSNVTGHSAARMMIETCCLMVMGSSSYKSQQSVAPEYAE